MIFKEGSGIDKLELTLLRGSYKLVEYSAKILYPMGNGENANVYIDVHCFNIQTPAPKMLFDDRRLISQNGKKATLKKFKKYKIYR
mgnify:CR=1 FL=1